MNLPNKITVSRFFVPPLFLGFLYLYCVRDQPLYYYLALAVFILAAISDGLDGYLARSRGLTTRLGTILDPLADKFFLNSAVIGMALLARAGYQVFPIPIWFALLMLGRDLLIVMGAFLVKYLRGKVEVHPSWVGKSTAVSEMLTVIWLLFKIPTPEIIIYITSIMIVISGAGYLRDGIGQLKEREER